MDALLGYVNNVYFDVPDDLSAAQYKVFDKDGTQVGLTANATVASGLATVALPYATTLAEGQFQVQLLFSYQSVNNTLSKYINVVTPILQKHEILKIHPNATAEEVWNIEAAVRYIVQNHCGQEFGHFFGTKRVYGRGSRVLHLPTHLISLTSVNDVTDEFRLVETSDGWELQYYPWGTPTGFVDGLYMTGGVITDPLRWSLGCWENGVLYTIDGEWGYLSIPSSVVEAAKLLVNDYACGDIQYRDRFLTSMTAADWRIQFDGGAFTDTGNVRANQLLEDYVVKNTPWVAI